MPTKNGRKFECAHCGRDFDAPHYQIHLTSLEKKGIHISTLDAVRRRAEGPNSTPITDIEKVKPQAASAPRHKSEPIRTLHLDLEIVNCTHCNGVLLITADREMKHIGTLEEFLHEAFPNPLPPFVAPPVPDSTLQPIPHTHTGKDESAGESGSMGLTTDDLDMDEVRG